MNSAVMQDFLIILTVAIVCLGLILLLVRWRLGGGIAFKLWAITSGLILIIAMDTYLIGRIGMSVLVLSVGTFLGVICFGAAIMAILRWVVHPLNRMLAVANHLAVGDVDVVLGDFSQDEIGQLGAAMEQIVDTTRAMAVSADRLADGDLTADITPRGKKDLLGNALGRMVINLRDIVTSVSDNAITLNRSSEHLAENARQSGQAAGQIAGTIQEITRGISEQAEFINRTASTVEQMSRAIDAVANGAEDQNTAVSKVSDITRKLSEMIQGVSANAETQVTAATKSVSISRDSSKTVEETIQGMQRIQAKGNLTGQKVHEMGQHSVQIGMIVETINEIASQTNLLALNAAIEAARAGDQGKGFAVVADEVRKLAEKSAGATREITGLVRAIQGTVSEAVQAMNESAAEIESGVVLANQSGQALTTILSSTEESQKSGKTIADASIRMKAMAAELVAAMNGISTVVQENKAATKEMAVGSRNMTHAIEYIASVSEENSAATEEVSASAEEMSAQVEEVNGSVQSLAGMVGGLQGLVARFNLDAERRN